MTKEELLEDLIKSNLMELVRWVQIRTTSTSSDTEHVTLLYLSPYQQSIADLAKKYGVPSPYDK